MVIRVPGGTLVCPAQEDVALVVPVDIRRFCAGLCSSTYVLQHVVQKRISVDASTMGYAPVPYQYRYRTYEQGYAVRSSK